MDVDSDVASGVHGSGSERPPALGNAGGGPSLAFSLISWEQVAPSWTSCLSSSSFQV